ESMLKMVTWFRFGTPVNGMTSENLSSLEIPMSWRFTLSMDLAIGHFTTSCAAM
ncbi:unnamed protein product, partial [marine sediment metagenome]